MSSKKLRNVKCIDVEITDSATSDKVLSGMGKMRRVCNIGIFITMLAILSFPITAQGLSNSGGGNWQYYRSISINNNGGGLTDYQVLVNLIGSDFPVLSKSDGSDIRFVDESGAELSYWIESWDYAGRSARIWVKVPGIQAGSIAIVRMYYGNPSADSVSNGNAVFEFFDDFNQANGSISNGWVWAFGSGSAVIENGAVKLAGGWIKKEQNVKFDKVYVESKFIAGADTRSTYPGTINVLSDPSNRVDGIGYALVHTLNTGEQIFDTNGPKQSISYGVTDGVWYNYKLLVDKSQTLKAKRWRITDPEPPSWNLEYNGILSDDAGATQFWLGDDGGSVYRYFDDVRIRKYASPEPTVTVGAEIKALTFVQLTDVHIGPNPDCYSEILNLNKCLEDSRKLSAQNLNQVVEDILKNQKPDFIIISGDLVEWNQIDQYNSLNEILDDFRKNSISVFTVPGNHDRRGKESPKNKLGTVWPQNDLSNYNNLNTYLDQIVRSDKSEGDIDQNEYRIIGLDSGYDATLGLIPKNLSLSGLSPNPDGSGLSKCGILSISCIDQIKFLSSNIKDDKTFVFMHHPAIDEETDAFGLKYWNEYNVIKENRREFIRLMEDRKVKLVLTGHTHDSKLYLNILNVLPVLPVLPGTCPDILCEVDIDVSKYFDLGYPIHLDTPLFIQTRSATKDEPLRGYLTVSVRENGAIQLEDKKIIESQPVNTLTIYSPADLHVYDEFGRHTGLNATGNIEDNVPGSYYFEENKMENITLPAFTLLYNATLNYTYELRSNFSKENITSNQSTFNFTIEQKTQSATTTVTYNDVLINNNSRAWINTNQTNYAMQIDLNNDGIIDTTKMPDSIVTDYAPTATILSPANGSTWNQGEPITFSGVGVDEEDGTLNNITWISNRDDVIGYGNFTTSNLSAGMHSIFLRVNDSKGQINTSNITIFVNDTKPPILYIVYPPENKVFNKPNITVSGIALDDSGILNVTVNGIQAGQESWNAILSLNEGQNIINVTATDNKGLSTTANRTVYYNSSLASDTEPPAAITNLTYKTGYNSVDGAWINWTWDNPKDPDFGYAIIYLDNIPMGNTSRSYFNLTGLSSDADYNISILTADIVDNINYTAVVDTARTPPPDTTPPTTTLTLSGSLGNNSWYISDVQVNLTATDNEGGSGVNNTEYSFDNAIWNTYAAPFSITNEGITTLHFYSTDNAGNVESTKNQTIRIDKTPPQITINVPTNGSGYILNQTVLANWSANDSISGIASATGTVPNGSTIDTGTVGAKTFNVAAADNASNTADQNAFYIVAYNYLGILPPIRADNSSIFKSGSTVSVKFRIIDANGNNVSTAMANLTYQKFTDDILGTIEEPYSTDAADSGNTFRYDSTDNLYIFNLDTSNMDKGTYQLNINLDDGTVHTVDISIKP